MYNTTVTPVGTVIFQLIDGSTNMLYMNSALLTVNTPGAFVQVPLTPVNPIPVGATVMKLVYQTSSGFNHVTDVVAGLYIR